MGRERVLACVLAAVAASVGCGGSGHHGSGDAGLGGKGGAGGSGGAKAPTLADHVVGRACSVNTDCGTGSCAMQLGGSAFAMAAQAPGGYCTGTCMLSTDCGMGGTCVGAFAGIAGIGATMGQCYAACNANSDCRDGYRCVASAQGLGGGAMMSTCQPAPVTDKLQDGVAGAMCGADSDCPTGRCLTSMNAGFLGGGMGMQYPGGYCSGRCLQDSDCGDVGVCMAGFAGAAGTCYRRCSADGDCKRDGYRCRALSNMIMACVPGAPPLPDDTAGKACTGDADCGGHMGSCAKQLPGTRAAFGGGGAVAAPGGYCSQACVDASDCGAGGVCIGAFGGTNASGTCYASCTGDSSCRGGYTCQQRGGAFGMGAMSVCAVMPPPPPENDAGATAAH